VFAKTPKEGTMRTIVVVATLTLLATLPAFAAGPVRSEAKVYYSNDSELLNRLGSLLGELDICTQGRTEDGESYLVIDAEAEQLKALAGTGLKVEITWPDIRDKFRAMTGCNPDDGSFRDFGYFFNYWEMRDTLTRLAANYPGITLIDTSMRSFQHKALWCLKISDNPQANENEPQIFINGASHAREPLGTHACIAFASLLCSNYGADSVITWLVNNREIYFVPVMNPDGYVYNSDSGGASSNWRKNRNNTSPRTGPGVDLNRNYGYKWGYDGSGSSGSPGQETYRGPSRFSEPETQVIRDFVAQHKFRTCMDFHTYGRYNMYAWGYYSASIPDQAILQEGVDTFAANNHYVQNGPVYSTIYPANGVSVDWEYADTLLNAVRKFITYAYTCEIGTTDFWYGSSYPSYVDNEVAINIPNVHYLTRVCGVYLAPVSMVVNDTANGNANGQLDPGESARLWFTVKNRAIHPLDTAKAVTAVLRTSDTMVQVLTPTVNFSNIPRRTTANNGAAQFDVLCNDNATPGGTVNLRLEVTYTDDGVTIVQPVNYRITLGTHPVAVECPSPDYTNAAMSLSAWPNPARQAIVFNALVPATSNPVGLTVYAQDGRLVRSFRALGPARLHSVVWDRRDGSGRVVPSGIYFAVLDDAQEKVLTKVVLTD
jgi:hypothetical protein